MLSERSDCWKMMAVDVGHDIVRVKWLPLYQDAGQPKRETEAKHSQEISVFLRRDRLTLFQWIATGQSYLFTHQQQHHF